MITDDNRFFFNGGFWKGKVKRDNTETGVKEINVDEFFDGKKIEHVGGAYEIKYVLVK